MSLLQKALFLSVTLFLFALPLATLQAAQEWKKGEMINAEYLSTQYKKGTLFPYTLYIPTTYDEKTPAAIYVAHDGLVPVHAQVLEKLSQEGVVPPCICIGVVSGTQHPTLPGGSPRAMRAEEYDQIGPAYPNFLVEEFIPWAIQEYGLNISASPDMHLIGGCSSGGISSWNCAWYRNDYFHRCYMSSPTFSAFRLGHTQMYDTRITEARPIRSYELFGLFEPVFLSGNSYAAAVMCERTLAWSGYSYKAEFFPEGGHGAGHGDSEVIERAMRYLWQDWETEPVRVVKNPERVELIVELGTAWEETTDPMPEPLAVETEVGIYKASGDQIVFLSKEGEVCIFDLTEGETISGLALSSDGWRLRIALANRRKILEASILPDGKLTSLLTLAPIRLGYNVDRIGVQGLCVDTGDNTYAATQMGIQVCCSFGLIDAILPLPGDLPADGVAFGGADHKTLYARSGDKVFKRPVKIPGCSLDSFPTPPLGLRYENL